MNCERHDGVHRNSPVLWLLWVVLLVAFAVRLVHLWWLADTGWAQRYLTATDGDDYAFFQWAQTILAGDWLGRDTYHPYFSWMQDTAPMETWYRWWGGKEIFHQAPLYPYLLAVLLALFNESGLAVFSFQLMVGVLQVFILYRLAAFLFDRYTGILAGGMTALYGPFVFHQTTLLRDWLSPVLEPLAVLVLLRAGAASGRLLWFLGGVCLGLALLVKESALLLAVFAVVWLVWEKRAAWRSLGLALACLLAGFVLTLSPLMIRNALVGAPVLALSNRGSEAFAMGNAKKTDPQALNRLFEQSRGEFLPMVLETIDTYYGSLVNFAREKLDKFRRMTNPYEPPNNVSYYYGLRISPVLKWTLGYAVIFPLGMAGLLLSLRAPRRHLLMYGYILSAVGTMVVTSPISRYRLVFVPGLIVYGAAVVVLWCSVLRKGQYFRALGLAALVGGFVIVQQVVTPYGQRWFKPKPYAMDYYAAAVVYKKRGEFDRGAQEMVQLYEVTKHLPSEKLVAAEASAEEADIRVEWAKRHIEKGELVEARRQVQLAAAAYARHPGLPLAYLNIGLLHLALGEEDRGVKLLERFVAIAPDDPRSSRVRELIAERQKP